MTDYTASDVEQGLIVPTAAVNKIKMNKIKTFLMDGGIDNREPKEGK